MTDSTPLNLAADRLAMLLKQRRTSLVLAESCTAGLVAASLARTPGISEFFCGSAVVYQIPTKIEWLGIDAKLIETHNVVSGEVAVAMASQVLERTPRAEVAGSITGHLGPNADPPELDGVVWCAATDRDGRTVTRRLKLSSTGESGNLRAERQIEAAVGLITLLSEFVEG